MNVSESEYPNTTVVTDSAGNRWRLIDDCEGALKILLVEPGDHRSHSMSIMVCPAAANSIVLRPLPRGMIG